MLNRQQRIADLKYSYEQAAREAARDQQKYAEELALMTSISEAARILGMNRKTFYNRHIKKYGKPTKVMMKDFRTT